MNKRLKVLIFLIIVFMLFFGGFSLLKKRKEQLSKIPPPEKHYYTVRGFLIKKGSITVKRDFIGKIRPENTVSISSKISGYIKKINVKIGQKVKKGDILTVIDDTQIKNQIKNVRISIQNLKLQLSSLKTKEEALKADLLSKKNIYSRDRRLFEKKAVSKEKVEKSYSSYLLAKSQLENIQNQIQSVKNRIIQLENDIKNLKNSLSYLQIRSPVDGIVQDILLREGNLVIPGKPVMKIEEAGKYEIIVKVPPDYPVKIGDKVIIDLGRNEKKYTVSAVYPSASDYLKVVKIKTGKKPEGIVSNSLLNISFIKNMKGFIVPKDAVLNLSSGSYVLTVSDGRFIKIPVMVKGTNKKFAVISGNIKEGMKVAVAEENKLRLLSTGKEGKIILEKEE